ncbi:hypothetical protein ACNKHU_03740 [Shigella flexneri]
MESGVPGDHPRARWEASLKDAKPEFAYQFEREGYFCADSRHSTAEKPVFNRTVGLRDTWAKVGE